MLSEDPTAPRPPSTRRLTNTYVACLWLIGWLVVTNGVYVLSAAIAMVGSVARITETSRQRSLTQSLAAVYARSASTAQARTDLASALQSWETNWVALERGDATRRLQPATNVEANALASLASERSTLRALFTESGPVTSEQIDRLDLASDRMVRSLDSITQSLTVQQEHDIAQLRRVQVISCLLLIALLVVVGRYAMQPAIRALGDLILQQHDTANTLRDQAESLSQSAEELEAQNLHLSAQRTELMNSQTLLLTTSEELMEQRALLEAHTRNLNRFRLTLDAMPDLVLMVALDGTMLYRNPAAVAAVPTIDQRHGLSLLRFLAKDSARVLRRDVLPKVMEQGVWSGEMSLRTNDAESFPVALTLIAQRDRYGYPEVFVVVAHDLREERRLTASLAEREALHRAVIDSLAEGVVVQDRDGQMVAWNESASRLFGGTFGGHSERAADLANWRTSTIEGVPLAVDELPISRARLHGERIDGSLIRLASAEGTVRELSVNARPMLSSTSGERSGAVATFTDVTAQRALHREMETLSVVVRRSNYAVLMTDATTSITWVNAAFEQLTGYPAAEVIGTRPGSLLQGVHTSTETVSRIRAAIREATTFEGELLNYRRDGTPYWVELSISPLRDASGVLTGFVGLSRDVTARRAGERERQTLAAALAVAADGVAIVDAMGSLEFVNQAFARQAGGRPEDLVGRVWLSTMFNEEEARYISESGSSDLTSLGFWHGEARGRRLSGEIFPQEVSLTLLPQGGMVAVVRDISERKAAEDRLKFLSTRDELTGLLNRRGFMHAADSVIRDARTRGRPCALLYGDLDSFKLINDRFGHPIGDVALQEVARLLSQTFRSSDLIARLGGDEFTVLACDVGRDEIERIMDRLDAVVAAHNAARSKDPAQAWTLGVSMGVAFVEPGEADDVDALLRQADAAQYIRKSLRKTESRAA